MSGSTRIYSIDLLRGLVMVIMALDHTRDFFHFDAFVHDPLDLQTTSPGLFFTRWITHYCAPVFVFLAGTSIYLQQMRKTGAELSGFLFKRGLWLVFIELIVINFAWTFDDAFRSFILQVIWAIGASMLCMAVLVRLPYRVVLAAGLCIVFGHNIFDYYPSTQQGFWWDLLRNGNFAAHYIGSAKLVIIYPVVPWLGVMMCGYGLGRLYDAGINPASRKKILLQLGFLLILLFIALRGTNLYGDPHPWSVQASFVFSKLSFLNTQKYPPSLLFVCMTLGPALVLLALFEKTNNRLTQVLSVYGRVPFFYYVLHFFILHLLCMFLWVQRGHALNEQTPDIFGLPFRFVIAGEGYSLTTVYLIWIGVVVLLYPLCKFFSDVKRKRKDWWLGYL